MVDPPFNPYAPPGAVEFAAPVVAPGDFDIGRTVTDAWEAVKRHFPLWLGVGFVAALLVFLSAITCIGYFVAVPVFAWGMIKFLLNMIEGRPSIDDLFVGFRNYLPVLGRMLLLFVLLGLMGIVSESLVFVGQFMHSTAVQVVGWIIYIAFFLGVFVRLYFSLFLIVDKDMGAIDSLSGSWRLTEGKGWKVLGLAVLSSIVAGAGILACGVGLLVTATMSYLMFASAYRQMVGPSTLPATRLG